MTRQRWATSKPSTKTQEKNASISAIAVIRAELALKKVVQTWTTANHSLGDSRTVEALRHRSRKDNLKYLRVVMLDIMVVSIVRSARDAGKFQPIYEILG